MQRERVFRNIIIILSILFIIFCYIGCYLSDFIEQCSITKSMIINKNIYTVPDYEGIDYQRFKSYCYNVSKPDIITIGSSRVLQFRKEFFTKSFYNLGYTIGSLEDIATLLPYLDKHHKPRLLIFGIDWWWFNNSYPIYKKNEKSSSILRPIKYILKGYVALLRGSIKIHDFFRSLKISLTSQESCTLNDGSYIYFFVTQKMFEDKKFQKTKQRIDENISPFFTARIISHRHIASFVEAAKELNKIAEKVIFILPPMSNAIFSDLKKDFLFYPHLFSLKSTLEKNGIKVYDFIDPQQINSSDCEMLDGFHAGEISYARILLKLANDIPEIQNLINHDYLQRNIKEYSGHAMIPNNYFMYPEIDFLELNCKK